MKYSIFNIEKEINNKQVKVSSTNNNNNRSNKSISMNNYKYITLFIFGLFMIKCEGGVPQSRNIEYQTRDKLNEFDEAVKIEQNEQESPVTSSDLPKQIPAPPRPHFASTPHYEQQLARFVWVTPQYNTPYPIANQV